MPRRFIAFYYLLTPLFWLADAVFGANLRVAALEGFPVWKALYYLFCFACGVAIWRRPSWTSVIGLGEATLNIVLQVLGFLLPYYRAVEEIAAGETAIDASLYGPARVIGFVLSSLVWVASFHLRLASMNRTAQTSR